MRRRPFPQFRLGADLRVVLVAFADEVNRGALTRLRAQADEMGCYDDVRCFTPSDLDGKFRVEFESRLTRSGRGFGYFVWKPQIVVQALRDLNDGDVVHYVDAGCHLNARATARFREYVNLCVQSNLGVLGFQNLHTSYPEMSGGNGRAPLPPLPMSAWTKGDLFDYFGVRNDHAITDAEQVVATTFFVQKRARSVRLMEDWLNVYRADFSLADDSPSRSKDLPGFKANRHDQAIFSLLCLTRRGFATVCLSEIEWQKDWELLSDTPIHARRDIKHNWRYRLRGAINQHLDLWRRIRFHFVRPSRILRKARPKMWTTPN